MGRSIDMERKGCESIACWTHNMTLTSYLTHDDGLFEITISQDWEGQSNRNERDVNPMRCWTYYATFDLQYGLARGQMYFHHKKTKQTNKQNKKQKNKQKQNKKPSWADTCNSLWIGAFHYLIYGLREGFCRSLNALFLKLSISCKLHVIYVREDKSLQCIDYDSLQWHHNGHNSVSNHQPHDCLLNRLFRRRW